LFYSLAEAIFLLTYYKESDSFISNTKVINYAFYPLIVVVTILFLLELVILIYNLNWFDGQSFILPFFFNSVISILAFLSLNFLIKSKLNNKITDIAELYVNFGVLVYYFTTIIIMTFESFHLCSDINQQFENNLIITISYSLINIFYCIIMIISTIKFSRQESKLKFN
jgi:hypothetical protein